MSVPEQSSLSALLDRYLTFYRSALKESSEQAYRHALVDPIEYLSANPIERITVEQIAELMTYLRKERFRSSRTIKYKLKLLKRLFQFAVAEGIITKNPVQFERLPALKMKLPNKVPFTYAQHQRVLKEAADFSLYHGFWVPACRIAWHTGLRMSDVAGMKWEHINFDDGIVTAYPKKKESVCQVLEIPMEPELREVLMQLWNARDLPNNPYVLPEFHANYVARRSWLVEKFGVICGRVGMPAHTFHSYRHGFVTRLINSGAAPHTISSMTGQTLEQIQEYAHITVDAKAAALEKSRAPAPSPAEPQSQTA